MNTVKAGTPKRNNQLLQDLPEHQNQLNKSFRHNEMALRGTNRMGDDLRPRLSQKLVLLRVPVTRIPLAIYQIGRSATLANIQRLMHRPASSGSAEPSFRHGAGEENRLPSSAPALLLATDSEAYPRIRASSSLEWSSLQISKRW